mgnify:CR=1 FL=1
MANWCFPVNMNLIFFGSLDLEKEEMCLTLKGNGRRNARIFAKPYPPSSSRRMGETD